MSKGVTAPLLITGVVVAVGNGWILAAWNAIYNWTHTGNASTPVPINQGGSVAAQPFKNPVTGAPTGASTINGVPQDIIPNNPQTNPNYS